MPVRLFVGNLSYTANEADIRGHFAAVGEPSQIVIPVDRETGRVRGFAFVDFDDRAVAEAAVRQFDGQPFKGRPLMVSEARPREERSSAPGPRPASFGGGAPPATGRPERESARRTFGPNKKPRRFGAAARQQSSPKGPLKERSGGRMFSVDEDARDALADHDEDEVTLNESPEPDTDE
jgi:cold-inducible RNA-binding protein